MTGEEFVDVLKIVVRDSAASEELSFLQHPPGKQPTAESLDRSAWYYLLENDQKRILSAILFDVADRAVFGFLCVLDGVRAIENGLDKGRLELRYVRDGVTLLNSPEEPMLHDFW